MAYLYTHDIVIEQYSKDSNTFFMVSLYTNDTATEQYSIYGHQCFVLYGMTLSMTTRVPEAYISEQNKLLSVEFV